MYENAFPFNSRLLDAKVLTVGKIQRVHNPTEGAEQF